MHPLAEQCLDPLPGNGSYFAQPGTTLADDDRLLALPLDVEEHPDVEQRVVHRPVRAQLDVLDHHSQAVRQLVPDAQLVLVDTPGLHRPRTLLGERLNDLVRETLLEVDVIGLCIPADEPVGAGDRFIARELTEIRGGKRPVVVIVTKADRVDRGRLAEQLLAVTQLVEADDVVPTSAVDGYQVDVLADVIVGHLEPGPALYPDGELTDEPERVMIAELVREAALEGVRDELPHSLAVVVDEIEPREGRSAANPLLDVRVLLYVERESQRGIVIGKGGARLRDVGTRARQEIQALLGQQIHLDLRVKVAKDWQRDPKQLHRLGF